MQHPFRFLCRPSMTPSKLFLCEDTDQTNVTLGRIHQRCTGSGFLDSSPAGFSTFWTNRIGHGLRFYSSFRIRIRIFKFHCFRIWRQHNHNNNFCKDLRMQCSSHQLQKCERGTVTPEVSCTAKHQSTTMASHQSTIFINCELS